MFPNIGATKCTSHTLVGHLGDDVVGELDSALSVDSVLGTKLRSNSGQKLFIKHTHGPTKTYLETSLCTGQRICTVPL